VTRQLTYLAYGSNLHPLRLLKRVPSATLLGVVNLGGQQVVFHKVSPDGSSKCDLVDAGGRALAFGALYRINSSDLPALDAVEGMGSGYDRVHLPLQFRGQNLRPFTYRAAATHIVPGLAPFSWYRDLVMEGALYLGLPDFYRRVLAAVTAKHDPDPIRHDEHAALVRRIRRFGRSAQRGLVS
jgi:hypothetical protein